jgi:hypothetical protein
MIVTVSTCSLSSTTNLMSAIFPLGFPENWIASGLVAKVS